MVRWPTTVTAYQFGHGNINLATAISIWPRQFQFGHGEINLATAISIWPRQFQFGHGEINLATAISIYTRHFHDVILARNVLWESIQRGGEWTEQLLKMFCANCGFTILHGANFCVQCGKGEFLSAYKCTQCTFNYFFPGKFSNHVSNTNNLKHSIFKIFAECTQFTNYKTNSWKCIVCTYKRIKTHLFRTARRSWLRARP